MIGFPFSFRSNHQLKTFLKRFLWINILHTTANYPTGRDYVPISPTKIYEKNDGSDLPYPEALSAHVYNIVSVM